ncbi:hypothetical protein BaRGS_00022630 [Batillaria attramentaria]|uniref:Uncharacterized protein n=1 Tax=Batillaria attramentaria TaxID=370345 RepID=A0ABD0KGH9_9CAEN
MLTIGWREKQQVPLLSVSVTEVLSRKAHNLVLVGGSSGLTPVKSPCLLRLCVPEQTNIEPSDNATSNRTVPRGFKQGAKEEPRRKPLGPQRSARVMADNERFMGISGPRSMWLCHLLRPSVCLVSGLEGESGLSGSKSQGGLEVSWTLVSDMYF